MASRAAVAARGACARTTVVGAASPASPTQDGDASSFSSYLRTASYWISKGFLGSNGRRNDQS
eukprot:6190886-Pleurochrysis_carterae.AAC.2